MSYPPPERLPSRPPNPHLPPPDAYRTPAGQVPFPGTGFPPVYASSTEARPLTDGPPITGPYPPRLYGAAPPAPTLPHPGTRLAARLIDISLWGFLVGLFAIIDALLADPYSDTGPILLIAWIPIAGLLVFVAPMARTGATFGKFLLKLQVVRADGHHVGAGRALAREVVYTIFNLVPVVCWLNPLSCLWDAHRRCWHDHIAGTSVIPRP